jgi:hypothetical protein
MSISNWVLTRTGKRFYPAAPVLKDISIIDIAWSLSMQCRYTGHTNRFYSVAEHSLYLAEFATPENQRMALLHDASEAYLTDIAAPVKQQLINYSTMEATLQEAIAIKFDLPLKIPEEVKELDRRIVLDELAFFMGANGNDWGIAGNKLGVIFNADFSPEYYYRKFLAKFDELRTPL